MKKTNLLTILVLSGSIIFSGCASMSNTGKGAAIGPAVEPHLEPVSEPWLVKVREPASGQPWVEPLEEEPEL